MLSRQSFYYIFFSIQFTQFLSIDDIASYRCICKRAKNTKINISLDHCSYSRLQLQNLIPEDSNEYDLHNTYIKMYTKYVYSESSISKKFIKYFDLFSYIEFEKDNKKYNFSHIEDSQDYQLYPYDLYNLSLYPYENTEKHYIIMQYNDKIHELIHHFILVFSSQSELIKTIKKIVSDLMSSEYTFDNNEDLYDSFINVLERDYYTNYIVKYMVGTFSECNNYDIYDSSEDDSSDYD